jgi:hypothetical protein
MYTSFVALPEQRKFGMHPLLLKSQVTGGDCPRLTANVFVTTNPFQNDIEF